MEEDVQEEVLSVWRAEHGIVADKGLIVTIGLLVRYDWICEGL